jgi:hypothetical protein
MGSARESVVRLSRAATSSVRPLADRRVLVIEPEGEVLGLPLGPDADRLAAFWAATTGYLVSSCSDPYVMLVPGTDDGLKPVFQRVGAPGSLSLARTSMSLIVFAGSGP